MLVNENPPNIRRIETDREDAYAFEITGHITAADMENMYGLLEGAYELHDKIDLLVLVHNYEGFDWAAALKEPTMVGKTHALKHIRKYAVVGGPGWMRAMLALFKPFMSMEMEHFEAGKADEAWQWLGAKPKPAKV
ncbi:SpoIIAA family protein [Mesorhizobium xinjiangense]|uniref:STAS/SEC14 domain-containing protein n=1 Tax=Mesorhizobium xinjiangense TaxID=2678685 RepID=UPI0012EE74F1|nr:STAS/SEC14 domain-containing protein [Mesorhizobium xinjiangense]